LNIGRWIAAAGTESAAGFFRTTPPLPFFGPEFARAPPHPFAIEASAGLNLDLNLDLEQAARQPAQKIAASGGAAGGGEAR